MTMNTGHMLTELQRLYPSLFDITPEILMGHLLSLDPEVTEPPATYDPSTDGPAFLRAAVTEYDISGLALLAYEHLMTVMVHSDTALDAMNEFCDHLDNLSPHAVCSIMLYPIFSMLRFQNVSRNYAMISLLSTYYRSRYGTDEEKALYLESQQGATPAAPAAAAPAMDDTQPVKVAKNAMTDLFADLIKGMTPGRSDA